MNGPDSPALGAWQARVQLDTPLGAFMGAQRVALLEAIERHGSIARAAKAVALGYKAAWEAVDEMTTSRSSCWCSARVAVRAAGARR